jgi:micrococcal nuclease
MKKVTLWRAAAAVFLTVALLNTGLGSGCDAVPESETVRVDRVIDGDTVIISTGERLRYIGINAPEVGDNPAPLALEAMEANRRLVEGKTVRLERDASNTDRFGRLLRYVWINGQMINREMVRLGLAEAVAYPPDTRYQTVLDGAEDEARAAGRGMWAQ